MYHQNNRRGPGRPKGTRGRYKKSRRDIIKTVRFTEKEWRAIQYVASDFMKSPSSLIRETAVEYAEKMKAWYEECDK